jgi:hypothetical protein
MRSAYCIVEEIELVCEIISLFCYSYFLAKALNCCEN